jgi:hypothetical protein
MCVGFPGTMCTNAGIDSELPLRVLRPELCERKNADAV